MTPKEKALELVEKFCSFSYMDEDETQFENAIQCAFIAVDEILGYMGADRGTEFWIEVKKEIQNL